MLNDDEATPKSLIGQKMAPILMKDDGSCMPESLDIVHYIDNLDREPLLTGETNPAICDWLRHVNGYVNKLLLPAHCGGTVCRICHAGSPPYFKNKKKRMLVHFCRAEMHSAGCIKNINDDLRKLDKLIVKAECGEW